MTNEYENALVPELIKDAVKQALTGNEPARQRLETIQAYITKALTTVETNAKLGFYKPKRPTAQKRSYRDANALTRPVKPTPKGFN